MSIFANVDSSFSAVHLFIFLMEENVHVLQSPGNRRDHFKPAGKAGMVAHAFSPTIWADGSLLV